MSRTFTYALFALFGVFISGISQVLLKKSAGRQYSSAIREYLNPLVIVAYAWIKKKGCPRNMDELMAIPADFGAPDTERMDLSVRNMGEVITISRRVQDFCREKGIDERRAYLAGLAMEEMAGNIVEHGFEKDKKSHSVDVRVVHKNEDVILRLKDDCEPFDPGERQRLTEGEDPTKNIGLRIVFKTARELEYQNILGMNVLTIRF